MDMTALKIKCSDHTNDQLIEIIASMQATIESLKQVAFGRKTERRRQDPEGMEPLFDEAEAIVEQEEQEEKAAKESVEVAGHVRQKRGKRAPLPKHLPRERREYDLPEAEKICPVHGTKLNKIGEKVTEQLDYVPAKLKVIENVTFTYKCPCCSGEGEQENLVCSKAEPQPIAKSFATPSLLAFLVVTKYFDAMPLYRIERQFARVGVELSRTTMARWMIQSAQVLRPLFNLMLEELLESQVLCCDETEVQVLKEANRSPQQKSYMWLLYKPYGYPLVVFHYSTSRSGKTAAELLQDFNGKLVCDGLKSYDSMAANLQIKLAGCLAHIRRKFFNAEKAAKKESKNKDIKASQALNMIRALYKIESEIKGRPPDEIRQVRQQQSKPILEQFKTWLNQEVSRTLPKSLLGKAISYALDQWPKMQVFLDDGLVPIDNNGAERCIRPFVIGRKNWIFSDTAAGAESSAILYSMIESAKANQLEPYSYLMQVFKELPQAQTLEDVGKLMPNRAAAHYQIAKYVPPK